MENGNINYFINRLYDVINELNKVMESNTISDKIDDLSEELHKMGKEAHSLDIDKDIKRELNYQVLLMKKRLVNYYNEQICILSSRICDIREKTNVDIKIPSITIKNIDNAQDKVNLDFKELSNIQKEIANLEKENHHDKEGELLFIEDSIKELEERIKDNNNISSILIDIDLLKEKLRALYEKYQTDEVISFECLVKLVYLDALPNKISASDYDLLRKNLYLFLDELSMYKKIKPDIDTIMQLETKYGKYKEEADTYKKDNKQLYINLLKQLTTASNMLNEIEKEGLKITPESEESKEEPEVKETEDEEVYHVETAEDSKDFYQKYEKQILLASGIASMALINTKIGSVLIPSIIFANLVAANKYAVISKINTILAKPIGAVKDEDGNYTKANKIKIDSKEAINSLLKGIASLKDKGKEIKTLLLNRVKDLGIVIKSKEHIQKIKNNINTRKEEFEDLKTIKLYYKFIISNKTLEQFGSTQGLNEEDMQKLIDYMNYKEEIDARRVK